MVRKALIGVLLLSIILSSLFADPAEASGSRTITGYKNLETGEIPDSICLVKIVDPNTLDVAQDDNLVIPLAYRGSNYLAFSFYCYGTKWRPVQISLTFNPMWLSGQTSGDDYIPYLVTLEHESSLVSGNSVPVNRPSNAAVPTKCSFLEYWFIYADQVQVASGSSVSDLSDFANGTTISGSVSNAAICLAFKYYLGTHTTVQDINGTNITSYPEEVCDYWNRNGICIVKLDMTADGKRSNGTSYKNGTYSASVVVNITSTN